jgi:hypothetical protein
MRLLAELERSGALVRESARTARRGRPVVRYRLAPDWSPPTADFRGLAELLAAAVLRAGGLGARGAARGVRRAGAPGVLPS